MFAVFVFAPRALTDMLIITREAEVFPAEYTALYFLYYSQTYMYPVSISATPFTRSLKHRINSGRAAYSVSLLVNVSVIFTFLHGYRSATHKHRSASAEIQINPDK